MPRKTVFTICTIILAATAISAAELSDYTTPIFSGAGNCSFCHDQWGRGLTDRRGTDVSIAKDWRGTMMAQAFKDPFWRATMEAEQETRSHNGGQQTLSMV